LQLRRVAAAELVGIPAGLRSRPADRLDDGIEVVGLVGVVGVMAEAEDVPELVERDVLDVVAAVRDGRLELAPLETAPVELVAVGPEGDVEVTGCVPVVGAREARDAAAAPAAATTASRILSGGTSFSIQRNCRTSSAAKSGQAIGGSGE
jgi:hypothetical protein